MSQNKQDVDVAETTASRRLPPEERKKRQEDVLWFKVLDRFGLPTLFSTVLLAFLLTVGQRMMQQNDDERKANRLLLDSFVASLNTNSKLLEKMVVTLEKQSMELHELGDRQLAVERKLGISK